MIKLSLNGEYSLKSTDGVYNCTAKIPGSDFGSLIAGGFIADPMNAPAGEKIARQVALKDYIFEKTFSVTEEQLNEKNAVIYFDKLDTICNVYLNGKKIISAMNVHIPYSADVKNILVCGENKLKLEFLSSLEYVEKRQKERAMPPNFNGVNGAQYLRKANCHFGWDWGPCIPYNYCGNVEIRFFGRQIENISIKQKTSEELSIITVKADNADFCKMLTPDGREIEGKDFTFEIRNPELWFTRDLSEKETQPLYTVIIGNDEMTAERKIGLRDIRLNREADKWGSNFQFVLNGKVVFAKGANCIPFAAIPEYAQDEDVNYYLELAAKCNFNMIRIWGGGEYASDYLLSRCDELGILIWQDFCFACMMYPLDDKDFLESVKEEAKVNIKRMDSHSCLALWCGNNEIEDCNPMFPKNSSLGKAYVSFFYNDLEKIVTGLSDNPFIPSSPVGKAPFSDNSDENSGDSHMWSVWHGLKPLNYYGKRYARFLSEFGLESLPSKKAIKKFAPNDTSIYSPAFMEHQKCTGGNRKMMFYLCEKFNTDVDFDLLPYLTGIVQAECIKAASEHFRRFKGRCNGSVFWQFNDVWNCPSWSAVDFEKEPKALICKAKDFFAPFTVTFGDGGVYLHNDTLFDKEAKITYKIFNNGRLKWVYDEKLISKAGCVKMLHSINLIENDLLVVTLNGKQFTFDNIAVLPKAKLDVKADGNNVTVKTDTYTRNVCIECEGLPEENYFSLMPGEEKTVTVNGSMKNLRVLCENNIEFKRKSLKKSLFRIKYRLEPQNLAQTVARDLHQLF